MCFLMLLHACATSPALLTKGTEAKAERPVRLTLCPRGSNTISVTYQFFMTSYCTTMKIVHCVFKHSESRSSFFMSLHPSARLSGKPACLAENTSTTGCSFLVLSSTRAWRCQSTHSSMDSRHGSTTPQTSRMTRSNASSRNSATSTGLR